MGAGHPPAVPRLGEGGAGVVEARGRGSGGGTGLGGGAEGGDGTRPAPLELGHHDHGAGGRLLDGQGEGAGRDPRAEEQAVEPSVGQDHRQGAQSQGVPFRGRAGQHHRTWPGRGSARLLTRQPGLQGAGQQVFVGDVAETGSPPVAHQPQRRQRHPLEGDHQTVGLAAPPQRLLEAAAVQPHRSGQQQVHRPRDGQGRGVAHQGSRGGAPRPAAVSSRIRVSTSTSAGP